MLRVGISGNCVLRPPVIRSGIIYVTKQTSRGSEPERDSPVEITPAMIEAGVELCRARYAFSDRHLSEAGAVDVLAIVCAVLGVPEPLDESA